MEKTLFFQAVAQLKGLKELHMPDWEAVVGEDVACVEPLYGLPHLEVVHVPDVKQSDAFPAELTFKAFEVAPSAGASPGS